MQIIHFCNSCISVKAGKTTLMCDPWFGPADQNAWLSFPFNTEGPDILKRIAPTIIYISHLHPDHHDPKTLHHIDRDTTILIKKFPDRRLYGKLEAQGFTNIIELNAWTPLTIEDDLEVAIIPSTSMVKEDIDAAISYDIDTSIIIRCLRSNQIFYNNVDNPTSLNALRSIREFSEKTWNKPVDIACLPVGAASEYPHCFINIDREKAAQRVIAAALDELPDRIEALGCQNFFLAGGTYVIRGKHSPLSKYIAQPTFEEVETHLGPWLQAGNKLLPLEGGSGVAFSGESEEWQLDPTGFEKQEDKAAYAIASSDMPYDYSDARGRTKEFLNRTKDALPGALVNYKSILERIGIRQDWTTIINLYEHLTINTDCNISDTHPVLDQITLSSAEENPRQTLTLHIDIGLFVDLLEGRGNWNGAISGSYILYERTPDTFIPDVPFSLNFLVNREKR